MSKLKVLYKSKNSDIKYRINISLTEGIEFVSITRLIEIAKETKPKNTEVDVIIIYDV